MFKVILRVLGLLKNRKKSVVSLSIANLIFATLILVEPIFFREIIDILVSFSENTLGASEVLFKTLILWILVGFVIIGVRLFVSIYSDRLGHEEYDVYVTNFYNHVLNLSARFHADGNSGELVKKITKGSDGIFMTHVNFFRRVMPNIMILILLVPTLLYFNWKLGLFVIVLGGISAVVTFYLAGKTFSKQVEIEDIYSDMSSLYGDTFSNINIVKSFTLGGMKNNELQKLIDIRIVKQFPILTWWGVIISFSQILKIIVSIGVIFFGSYLFMNGEISIGEIVMFLSFSVILLGSIEELVWKLEDVFWRLAGIKEYFEILDSHIEVVDREGAKDTGKVHGNVSFEAVTFSYDGKRRVLSDIDLSVKAGEKIAFVGHTGSGKTTMTNMLLRFYEPQSGDIKIDDTSIYDMTLDSLRANIGVVFQDNSLFNTTILENIRLDNQTATRSQIEQVAKKSHATDFIQSLSEGFDTEVGERGVKLSGGEKQRLAIARAFLKDAPILILDEATSALDAETEQYLQASFDELMEGRTTFIIAHRLSTIKKADRIFVFDHGAIVEQGSYSELVSKKGSFARLVSAQTDGFLE